MSLGDPGQGRMKMYFIRLFTYYFIPLLPNVSFKLLSIIYLNLDF